MRTRRWYPTGRSLAPSVPSGWRLVALIGTLTIFGPLCIDMYLPAFPRISRQLHVGASSVQITLTACMLGISVGQLLLGPISDRIGRRPPLLAGLGVFVVSSVACALAPDIVSLTAFRLLEGLGGAAGIVIARSVVRDLHSGLALVRFFSTLMLATGLGPIIAPQVGSWVLAVTSWRGIFVVLALFGFVLLISAWRRIPETLPEQLRGTGSLGSTMVRMGSLVRDRTFLGYALACGLGMSGVFAYVAGSSFVLQNVYGMTPLEYGAVFALNACGLILGAQVNGHLAARFSASSLLRSGLTTMMLAGAAIVVFVTTGAVGLPGVIPALFVVMFGNGFVGPNSLALALQRYPDAAGSASAVVGFFQFSLAAVMSPVAGVGGTHDALPMALLILVLPGAGLLARAVLCRPSAPRTAITIAASPVP